MITALTAKVRERGGLRGLLTNRMVQNTLLLYGVQISGYLVPLATLPFLSRVLGPEKIGLVFFAQSFMWYFITLADYGFALTATRRISVHRADVDEVSRTFSAVMGAKLLLMVAGFLLLEGVVFAVPKLRPEALLFTVSFLSVVGNTLFPIWFFQGMQRLEQVALRDFVAKGLSVVLLFALVRSEDDYILAAAIQSGGVMVAGLAGLLQVWRIMPVRWSLPTWTTINAELKEGWPVFLSMAALAVTASTNVVILGFWAPAAEIGYYSSAYRVIVAIRALVSPLVSVIYPHISHMVTQDKARAIRFLQGPGFLLPAPFAVLAILMIVGAPWVVPVLFGEKYLPTIPLLQILALSPFLLALSHNYSTYYMLAFGYDSQWSRIILRGALLNFVLLFALLTFMKPAFAVSVTSIAVDLFGVLAAYAFFRRTALA